MIRVLVDREDNPARFLIQGSASRDLIQQSSETLAGRIAHIELTPFLAAEVGAAATYMVRQLPPWHENLRKRQVKSPKTYLRDSGLLHTLLGVEDSKSLSFHPTLGVSWEGFALEQIIQHYQTDEGECYFWSAYGRAEMDLLLIKGAKRFGFGIKHTGTPKVTTSLLTAQADLAIDELVIVIPGTESFPLTDTIRAIGLEALIGG